jgi:excisionase family DNA binding protein
VIEVEKHYRTKEAAELLGVHVKTLGRWIMSGEIAPVVAISQRDTRIPASVLQRFLDHRTIRRGASAL